VRKGVPLFDLGEVLLDVGEEEAVVELDDVEVGGSVLDVHFDLVDEPFIFCWP
jgi:hypothetical protein